MIPAVLPIAQPWAVRPAAIRLSTNLKEGDTVMDEELAFAPATELLELISTKQVSPVELTELYFNRIDRLDSQLNSYLLFTYEDAIRTARRSEEAVIRGDDLGPLHGLPIPIKDTQMTKGVRTTLGSLVFKDRVP